MGEMNEQAHRLLLEQRKTLSLGGVQDVKSFDENEVLLVTVCGVPVSYTHLTLPTNSRV